MGCSAAKDVDRRSFHEKYILQGKLGKGAFAQVRLAICNETQRAFAVKILDIRENPNLDKNKRPSAERLIQELRAEQKAWKHVGDHPHCVRLRDFFVDDSFGYFVMERCASNLLDGLRTEPELNEHTYVRYFREMALGIAHVHSMGVVHRDVKQDNFLLGGPTASTVKLCDFGLSAVVPADGKLNGVYGTAPYMSPEMISRRAHGPKTDIWSLGVVVYSAFFGQFPYNPKEKNSDAMKQVIREGFPAPSFTTPKKMTRGDPVTLPALDFVRALLQRDQNDRPSAQGILEMTYVKDADALALNAKRDMQQPVSLAPMLLWAVRAGAFGTRAPQVDPHVDSTLEELQSKTTKSGNQRSRPSTPECDVGSAEEEPRFPDTHGSRRRQGYDGRKTSGSGTKMAWESGSTKAASSDRDDQHSNSSVQLSFPETPAQGLHGQFRGVPMPAPVSPALTVPGRQC